MKKQTSTDLRRALREQRAAYEELLGLSGAILAALCDAAAAEAGRARRAGDLRIRGGGRRRGLRALVPGARDMIDLEDEKERILEQLAAMVADASVKPELRLKAAGMVLGHERGKAAPAKDEGETEPEVLRFEGALEQWSR